MCLEAPFNIILEQPSLDNGVRKGACLQRVTTMTGALFTSWLKVSPLLKIISQRFVLIFKTVPSERGKDLQGLFTDSHEEASSHLSRLASEYKRPSTKPPAPGIGGSGERESVKQFP